MRAARSAVVLILPLLEGSGEPLVAGFSAANMVVAAFVDCLSSCHQGTVIGYGTDSPSYYNRNNEELQGYCIHSLVDENGFA